MSSKAITSPSSSDATGASALSARTISGKTPLAEPCCEKERSIVAPLVGDDSKAVELELEEPARPVAGALRSSWRASERSAAVDRARLGAHLLGLLLETPHDSEALAQLFDEQPREHAARLLVDDGALLDVSVGLLQ